MFGLRCLFGCKNTVVGNSNKYVLETVHGDSITSEERIRVLFFKCDRCGKRNAHANYDKFWGKHYAVEQDMKMWKKTGYLPAYVKIINEKGK